MLDLKATTRPFLIYLILLWNLGPSLHHADCFGIHIHTGHSHQSHHQIADDEAGCGCCCHHGHSTPTQEGGSQFVVADQDCGFCHFFDQFNFVDFSFEELKANSPAQMRDFFWVAPVVADSIRLVARGPPLFRSSHASIV